MKINDNIKYAACYAAGIVTGVLGSIIFRKASSATPKQNEEVYDEVPEDDADIPETVEDGQRYSVDTEKATSYGIEPYEISQGSFVFDDADVEFEKIILWYNTPDGLLYDSNGELFNVEIGQCIGIDNFERFKANENEQFMYIRNERMGIDFELIKN